MQAQAAPEAPVEAPQKPALERVPREPPSPKGSADALVEAALDALSDEPAERDPAPTEGGEQARPEDREEDDASAPDADESGEERDLRGSKDEPFNVKDLPSDKYIELKVDGEKTVVPMSELAAGYIREATFSKRINQTQQLTAQAEAYLQKAVEFPKKLQSQLQQFMHDPEALYEFFLASDEREQVFEQAARKYAELRRAHRQNPDERLAFRRQRDQARLQAEREAFEHEREQERTQKQQAEYRQRAEAVFKPGWEAGLRKAGFPKPTPDLYQEVMLRCQQRVQSGGVVTSDDVAEFVVRAARLLELPKAGDKPPRAAPQAPPKARDKGRQNGWDKVPPQKRRRDPDYFLSALKPRDFR